MRRGAAILIATGLALSVGLAIGSARAEVQVEVSLETEAIAAGETTVLAVTVTGASNVDQGPDIPDTPGLTFRQAGRSTNISIVNGHMTRSISWNVLVLGEKPGQYTIGPVEVRDRGKAYRSGTVTLSVADAGSSMGGPGGPGGAGGRGRSVGPSGPGATLPPAGNLDQAPGDVFARATVDRDHVILGEQVTLRFQVWVPINTPVLDSQVASLPTTEGFWREDLPPQRTSAANVQGRPYQVTEFAFALFPTRAGRLEIGEGAVDLVIQDRRGGRRSLDPFGFFANYPERRVRLQSKSLAVRVDPLPEPRPEDFTGGVGSFQLHGALERTETGQNEPLTLVLTVTGTGNVSTVGDPRLPDMPGVRTYPSGSDAQTSRDGDQLGGTKTFRLVLVPESTGRKEVPPVRFSIFDPKEHRYVRLETPRLAYTVNTSTSPAGAGGEVARTGRDLRTIRTGGRLVRIGAAEPWRAGGFWLLQGVPLILLAAGLSWRARRRRREADWGGFLSRGAPGRLRRELQAIESQTSHAPGEGYDRLEAALDRYFTDRFHVPARGLTREELAAELARQGVDEEAIVAARALLDRCDFARFAPAARTEADLRELLAAAREVPAGLERGRGSGKRAKDGAAGRRSASSLPVLLAALAFGAGVGDGRAAPPPGPSASAPVGDLGPAASSPLTGTGVRAAFERGNEAYGRGDYAEASASYRSILASGYESPELYLDLGNAAYRAGHLGWAVYWFARGHRIAPGDPDLGTNLESVLAETRDRAVGDEGSRFLGGLTALQDRVSAAAAARRCGFAWLLFAAWLSVRLAFSGGSNVGAVASRPFRLAGMVLGAVLVLSASWVLVKLAQASGAPSAVVVADELRVRSNPEPDATVEFTLHAGTRVRLGRASNGYREVLYSDKLHGWGPDGDLAQLSDDGVREAASRER